MLDPHSSTIILSLIRYLRSIQLKNHACVFCESNELFEVMDFGDVAIAGAFLKEEDIAKEKKYPLAIDFCKTCFAVQVRDHIDPDVLFKTDFYFSSAIGTLRSHFTSYALEVTKRFFAEPREAVVLEFGSNDGVLLKPFADLGVGKVIGVDPAKNIVNSIDDDRLTLINDYFNVETAKKIVEVYGKVDLVSANNVFAHISDINNTTEAVSNALKDDGVFVFEVHYLGKILEELQYDFIYHEHIYYYSLLALENLLNSHGMIIFDIKEILVHGGSVRYYAAKKGSKHSRNVSIRVNKLKERELALAYDKPETYKKFAAGVKARKQELMNLLKVYKANRKTIVGYGASGRANTIIQYCGINSKHLDYVIDDAPAKLGLFTPGSHLQIRNNKALLRDNPDYVLLFAWAFANEIMQKNYEYLNNGGKVIVPLPEVAVLEKSNFAKI